MADCTEELLTVDYVTSLEAALLYLFIMTWPRVVMRLIDRSIDRGGVLVDQAMINYSITVHIECEGIVRSSNIQR